MSSSEGSGLTLSTEKKVFYFFPVLFSFCLPFGSLVLSWIIIVWTLVSFFNIDRSTFNRILKNRSSWLPLLFFIATIISALLSENKKEAAFSVEVKMTLLILPYLFFGFSWPLSILRRSIIAFVSGCFFATLYLLLRATSYSMAGQTEYFYYTLFSDLLHASYFSMYLQLALAFVVVLYPRWFHQQKAIIRSSWFFAAIFILGIFLCASKMGLITFFCLFPLLLVYRLRKKIPFQKMLVLMSALFLVVALILFMLPQTSERLIRLTQFSTELDKSSTESSAVRVLIWEQCIDLVKAEPLWGYGVGDANDELYKRYETNGITGALSHHLNAHNQFFQTTIGMGILGLLLLLGMTLFSVINAAIKRRLLLLIFSGLILLNFLVESMLQTSAGILFFSFFYSLLHLCDRDLLLSPPLMNAPINDKSNTF